MKKNLLLLAAMLFGLMASSQNKLNLVIFSEDAEPFFAYVNGVKQNDKAETNVKITGLSPNISLKIIFENKALPELKKSMSLEPGFEHTAPWCGQTPKWEGPQARLRSPRPWTPCGPRGPTSRSC